jgi:hypothetical protein
MISLLEALRMEIDHKFNIKASRYLNGKIVEKTLAKYYNQIRELNHKLKFTRRLIIDFKAFLI